MYNAGMKHSLQSTCLRARILLLQEWKSLETLKLQLPCMLNSLRKSHRFSGSLLTNKLNGLRSDGVESPPSSLPPFPESSVPSSKSPFSMLTILQKKQCATAWRHLTCNVKIKTFCQGICVLHAFVWSIPCCHGYRAVFLTTLPVRKLISSTWPHGPAVPSPVVGVNEYRITVIPLLKRSLLYRALCP